jgi:hypothetical protein
MNGGRVLRECALLCTTVFANRFSEPSAVQAASCAEKTNGKVPFDCGAIHQRGWRADTRSSSSSVESGFGKLFVFGRSLTTGLK